MKFGVYVPAQIGWGGQFDPEVDRSMLVPFVHDGINFPNGVHKLVAPLFHELLNRILPLIPDGLQSPGCWGYNAASKSSGGGRSFHTYGLAIDVNAPSNPMNGNRVGDGFRIPDEVSVVARDLGFEWGGDWTSPKDWMHFDYHGSPAEAAAAVAQLSTGALSGSALTKTSVPTVQEDDDMQLIQGDTRGIALIGPGYFRALTDNEEVALATKLWGDPKVKDDRSYDVAKALALGGRPDDVQLAGIERADARG